MNCMPIIVAALVLCGLAPAFAQETAGEERLPNAFFAMDTGTKDAAHTTAASQAAMLKELGYAGIGYTGFDGLAELFQALDANGLKMFTTYLTATVEPDKATYDPAWKEGIKALKGRDAILWLNLTSTTYKPSAVEGDAVAVEMLREIADLAQASGARVALYPHTSCWLERVDDCVRLAKKVDRKNVGVTFNLCHWLNAEKGQNLNAVLETAMPYLFVVTINGADKGADAQGGWDRLIQTLDKGSFDVGGLLKTLDDMGYTGPIGLQGYGIKGDVHDNLQRSMAAWRKLSVK